MKIAVASDFHIHPHKQFGSDDGGYNSRLLNSLTPFDDLIVLQEKTGFKVLVITGDLLEKRDRIDHFSLMFLFERFRLLAASCEIFIVLGNHDCADRNGQHSIIHELEGVTKNLPHDVHVVGGYNLVPLQGFHAHFLSYRPEPDYLKKLSEIKCPKDRKNILFTHAAIENSAVSGGFKLPGVPKSLFKKFDLVVAGDNHKPQFIKPNVLIPGSVTQHDWGESGEDKYIWLLDVDEGKEKVDIKRSKTTSSRFINVNVNDENEIHKIIDASMKHFIRANFTDFDLYKQHSDILFQAGVVCVYNSEETTVLRESIISGQKSNLQIMEEYLGLQEGLTGQRKKELLKIGKGIIKKLEGE